MLEFKFSLVQRMNILLGSCLPDVQDCKSIASACNKFSFRHFMTQAKSTYINREKTDRLLENKSACLSLEKLMELLACRYHTCLWSFLPFFSSALFLQLAFGEEPN